MTVAAGTRLGVYEVVAPLGTGGMGEVYRARDTKLGREVAIKVLPDSVALDPDRTARFEREARALAALNHAHIAALFGMEVADRVPFLVMELVEGETLAERVQRGPLPLDEVLRIALQIADALEAAHEKGIVHRDLKPANVKLTPADKVKVLDFGLARIGTTEPVVAAGSPGNLTHSPTLSMMATQQGVILGTAAYMSPEQAKGLTADHRSDVFSFGVVLFELLTGRQPFQGETATDVMASVLAREADLGALPADLNPRLVELLKRCLEKSPRKRWQAIGDLRADLETIAAQPRAIQAAAAPLAAAPPAPFWKRAVPAVVAAALAVLATWGALSFYRRTAVPTVARFTYLLPADHFLPSTQRPMLAISADGSNIVYPSMGTLYIRPIAAFEGRLMPGTDLGGSAFSGTPVFSPDGKWIAFYTNVDRTIKKIAVSGGAPVTICATNVGTLGMSWTGDDILYSSTEGILRVSSNGGKPQVIVRRKGDANEAILSPALLPGGEAVIFTVAVGAANWDRAQIVAQSLKSGDRTVLIDGGFDGRYVPSGHLVYAQGGVVFAVAFDPKRLRVTGGPVPVVEGVARGIGPLGSGFSHFSVSDAGSLVYVPGPTMVASSAGTRDLLLEDRSGAVERLKIPPANYAEPRISPDGKRVVFGIDEGTDASVWIYELSGATAMRRLTFGSKDHHPIWSPDGQRVTFQSDRDGDPAIYSVSADGGTPERLTKPQPGELHIPQSWSPRGDYLLFDIVKGSEVTLWSFSRRDQTVTRFADVRSAVPTSAQFSPDGNWVAYATSNDPPPRDTLYVQPFPPTGRKYQISRTDEDGHHPIWSPDGKELSFIPNIGLFAAVSVTLQPSFTVGNPVPLPRRFSVDNAPANVRSHDITPDGRRFIGIAPASSTDAAAGSTANAEVRVVLNWIEELKQRVPTR